MNVDVIGGEGCADPVAIERAVRPIASAVDVAVELLPEGERHAVQVRVSRRGALIWSRDTVIGADDCPHLPELVAITVQQGLAGFPELEGVARPVIRGGFAAAGTVGAGPIWPGGQLSGRVAITLRGVGAVFEVRGGATAFSAVGSGEGRLDELLVGVGPTAHRGPLTVHALALAGVGVARGRGFARDEVAVAPRLAMGVGAGWAVAGPLTVEVGVAVPITRIVFVGDAQRLEAPARVAVGVGLVLPTGDVGADDRAR